jgi:thioredoxin-related protein
MSYETALISRRHLLGAAAAVGLAGAARSQEAWLPVLTSLPDALAAALAKHSPLLVMVSLEGCPFCKVARTNYLLPLQRQTGLSIVQIDMRNRQSVLGFDGGVQTQDQTIRNWGIKVAPTVLFFGRAGVEVAERLVGAYIPDFYGYYLDERVRAATTAVNG